MGDLRSGHCECRRWRLLTWAIWFMLALALLLSSAAVFLGALRRF
jgi:hypothetical protein